MPTVVLRCSNFRRDLGRSKVCIYDENSSERADRRERTDRFVYRPAAIPNVSQSQHGLVYAVLFDLGQKEEAALVLEAANRAALLAKGLP